MDDLTTEQIAKHYTAMGHSVSLINDIIAGDAMADDAQRKTSKTAWIVTLRHLEIMVGQRLLDKPRYDCRKCSYL
jgi:lipopolysaccharide biosynthesis regulator YciM